MKSLTKKIFITIITGIIIIIFGAWGMGDLFSTGNKNIVAEVDSKKIYIKDYLNYARLYVRKKNNNQLGERDHAIILNGLISEKIYEKFAEDLGIIINDKSLAFFIKNDENFKDKNGKFSRIEYEKYLLINNLNPKTVESFYKKELIKKISIDVFINGISDTKFHITKLENDFLKQVKIEYYKLDISNIPSEKEISDYFISNKDKFSLGEMRNGQYADLGHASLGFKEENDEYYKTIDKIENDLINNLNFSEIIKKYKLNIKQIELMSKAGLNKTRLKSVQSNFSKALFSLNKNFSTEIFEIDNAKYLINIKNVQKKGILNLNNQIKKEITTIINFQKNKLLSEKIERSKNNKEFYETAKKNNLKIKEIFFKNILDGKKIFNQRNMQKIFSKKTVSSNLSILEGNNIYIVRINKISKNKDKKENLDYALSNQIKQDFKALILRDLDKYLIKNYPVKLNNKIFNQVKKSL